MISVNTTGNSANTVVDPATLPSPEELAKNTTITKTGENSFHYEVEFERKGSETAEEKPGLGQMIEKVMTFMGKFFRLLVERFLKEFKGSAGEQTPPVAENPPTEKTPVVPPKKTETPVTTPPTPEEKPKEPTIGHKGTTPSTEPEMPESKESVRDLIMRRTGNTIWRPRGKRGLATLYLRPNFDGKATEVKILDKNGEVIGIGKRVGTSPEGRPTYVFDKPGNEIPRGSTLVVTMKKGGTRTLDLNDPGKLFRY